MFSKSKRIKQKKNDRMLAHPTYLQEVTRNSRSKSLPTSRKYVVSMDGERFFLVSARSPREAASILMSIGVNPDTSTKPPLPPGSRKRIYATKSGTVIKKRNPAYMYKTAVPISKAHAMRLINRQSTITVSEIPWKE